MKMKGVTKASGAATNDSSSDHDDRAGCFYAKCKALGGEILDADQESACSSEDNESPRSVVRKGPNVHNQVLRIREEDSLIGEDVAENLINKNYNNRRRCTKAVDRDHVFVSSHAPVPRPASPLGRS
uniref:Uncharacterized protein n=1 Tax=Daucus carota subsp. sativus TaxID=79200 RepID=A0A166DZX1_DAUCS|nr:PREDICTED: uncharacterized protein LOC108208265 [Daucus carota subsp. sativus]